MMPEAQVNTSHHLGRNKSTCVCVWQLSPFLFYFILFFYLLIDLFGFFRDRVSLYSPGCPGTHSVDQAGLELTNLPASASRAEIKGVCHHARLFVCFFCSDRPPVCCVAKSNLELLILLPMSP